MYKVYILKSEKDGRLYKGFTSNLESRIREHNQGKTKSTRNYRPWTLVYQESFETKEEARDRELFFKSGEGRELLKSILE